MNIEDGWRLLARSAPPAWRNPSPEHPHCYGLRFQSSSAWLPDNPAQSVTLQARHVFNRYATWHDVRLGKVRRDARQVASVAQNHIELATIAWDVEGSNRLMWQRLQRKVKSEVLAVLDAGSTRTRCMAFERIARDGSLTLLAYADEPSSGWVRGRVANPAQVRAAIAAAITKSVNGAKRSQYEGITMGIGGPGIWGRSGKATWDLGQKATITLDDVVEAAHIAAKAQIGDTETKLSVIPTSWKLDDEVVRKPVGLTGSRLQCSAFEIIAPAPALSELEATLLGFKSRQHPHYIFEAVAASRAVLSREEFERGAIVVDVGAQSSGLAAWQEGQIVAASGLAIGGDLFSRDAAAILKIPFEEAERLKIQYGLTRTPDTIRSSRRHSLLDVSMRDDIQLALEARADEFARHVRSKVDHLAVNDDWTMVLVGGGAQMKGFVDYMGAALGCAARLGRPGNVSEFPKELQRPEMSVLAGLAMGEAPGLFPGLLN